MSFWKLFAMDKRFPALSCVGTCSLGRMYCEVQPGTYDDECAPENLDNPLVEQKALLVPIDEVVPWTAGDHIIAEPAIKPMPHTSEEAMTGCGVGLPAIAEDKPRDANLGHSAEDNIPAPANVGHGVEEDIPLGVANLGRGVLWQYCPWSAEGSSPATRATKELAKLTDTLGRRPSACQLAGSLLQPCKVEESGAEGSLENKILDSSWVLVPEDMDQLDRCFWKGDGHYDMSRHPWMQPPSLGQVMTFLKLVDAAAQDSGQVLCLSSSKLLAHCAVLAGAVLVLARGLSAQEAWEELLRTCPNDVSNPCKAWDRFPPPFCPKPRTGPSSLSVKDCLAGLEFARDSGWISDFQSFDVLEWEMLRRKLDASWLIPGKLLAMANPWGSSQNPKYPGLLKSAPSENLPELGPDSDQNGATDVPSRLQSARGLQIPSLNVSVSPTSPTKFDRLSTPHSITSTISGVSMYSETDEASPGSGSPISPISPTSPTSLGGFSGSASDSPIVPDQTKIYMEEPATKVPVQTFSFRVTSRASEEVIPQASEKVILEACHVQAPQVPLSLTAVRDTDTFMTYLQRTRVLTIFRLNKNFECPQQSEHEEAFGLLGIDTKLCSFEDGGIPTASIVKDFLRFCKTGTACVAVHCMGGLGRTACVVAAYAVSRFKMTGPAFHGWSRICRPGSVQTVEQERFIRGLRPKSERVRSPSRGSRGCGVAAFVKNFAEDLKSPGKWV